MLLSLILALASQSSEPRLIVEPETRLFFEPQTVRVEGARHGAMVILEAEFTTEIDGTMTSSALFFADENGVVDVSQHYASGGTYEGVEPHGLIWSALLQRSDDEPVSALTSLSDIQVTYRARVRDRFDTMVMAELEQQQTIAALKPGIVTEEISEGALRGALFYPEGVANPPTVITMQGSGGRIYEREAALYANEGFAVLALGIFNYKDRPETLKNISLEYVRDAADYMSERFGDERTALIGHSRGAELAMLVAVSFPDRIDAVLALGPHNVIDAGCCTPDATQSPAWTLGGEPLPVAKGPVPSDMRWEPPEGQPLTFRPYFHAKTLNPDGSGAPIKVEQMDAPIMLVAGTADRLWPAAEASYLIEERLMQNDYPHEVVRLIYPGAGHSAGTIEPFAGLINYFESPEGGNNPLGGTMRANAKATYDAFPVQVAFLKKHTGGEVMETVDENEDAPQNLWSRLFGRQ